MGVHEAKKGLSGADDGGVWVLTLPRLVPASLLSGQIEVWTLRRGPETQSSQGEKLFSEGFFQKHHPKKTSPVGPVKGQGHKGSGVSKAGKAMELKEAKRAWAKQMRDRNNEARAAQGQAPKALRDTRAKRKRLKTKQLRMFSRGLQKNERGTWFQDLWSRSDLFIGEGPYRDRFNEPFPPFIPVCVNFFFRYVIELDRGNSAKPASRESFYDRQGYTLIRVRSGSLDDFYRAEAKIREIRATRPLPAEDLATLV